MLTIDGRTGGGQLVRTALSLSAIGQTPFAIENVRGTRPEPGLKPQHVAAVRAMANLCDADVSGATAGSKELTFRPGPIRPSTFDIDIGTAGSITLLFDVVLPLATAIEAPVELTVTGGTDVKWSPTIGYLGRVKLPLLARFGLVGTSELERTGFYPAGGGRARLRVEPSSMDPLGLEDRGPLTRIEVFSKASEGLADREVAERQARRAESLLRAVDVAVEVAAIDYVDSRANGSALLLRADYTGTVAGFDALGERRKTSERVALEAVDKFCDFHHSTATVDEHMGDQLLVFIALAGGQVRLSRTTDHIASNSALIEQFGYQLHLDPRPDGTVVARA